MPTHIILNGRKYDSPEAMPEEVRKAYQETLDQLRDIGRGRYPNVFNAAVPRAMP